jgi:hypothetical protein
VAKVFFESSYRMCYRFWQNLSVVLELCAEVYCSLHQLLLTIDFFFSKVLFIMYSPFVVLIKKKVLFILLLLS